MLSFSHLLGCFCTFFDVGEVDIGNMEFDLISFTLLPTLEGYNRCRKKDLVSIADFFNINISRESTKQVIKEELFGELVKAGILAASDKEGVVEEELESVVKTAGLDSIPNMDPRDSGADPFLAIKLRELDLRVKQEECEAQRIKLRVIEAERERDSERHRHELEALRLHSRPTPSPRVRLTQSPQTRLSTSSATVPVVDSVQPPNDGSSDLPAESDFDISKYIRLVPPFREAEVDSYFTAFERVAAKLRWPKDMWALLLQCNLSGKAQGVSAALPIEQSLDYDLVKSAVLRAYELVPEAYRQKFRSHAKTARQTYVEFAREKKALFEKWCFSSKISTFVQLQELILLEDFKACVPESVVVHLNEQKVQALTDAAIIADEFVLTHRNVFSSTRQMKNPSPVVESSELFQSASRSMKTETSGGARRKASPKRVGDKRVCFYCLDPGHLISECKTWKQKSFSSKPKNVALVQSVPELNVLDAVAYQPFLSSGSVSFSPDSETQPVRILRDTGAMQSLILEEMLPFSPESYTGSDVLIRGCEMGCVNVPLHRVYLESDLVTGPVTVGVCSRLPVEGVSFILGNELAGGKVFPRPIVTHQPSIELLDLSTQFSTAFPACVVTRAQSKKAESPVDLSDTVLFSQPDFDQCEVSVVPEMVSKPIVSSALPDLSLKVGKKDLVAAQTSDSSLASCIDAVVDIMQVPESRIAYYWEDGVLMRKWKPQHSDLNWQEVHQIVLPSDYRSQVLQLAHESALSGHLGVTKTFHRVSKYFFWPGLKSSVSRFVRSCHTCQLAGNPNQIVPPAPLIPIPVVGEPFERLLIDCVGPLPKSKSGHLYILTIMCAVTRYPEAIPLRTLKAKTVVQELIRFCSIFGLPKVIQSDQGTNFTSKVFSQMLSELGIKHQLASAYHPQSQGALERFHQTLKSMLRKFCTETGKDWVEGLPLIMFAVRESVQESLGFSPAELVFGHTVRGPLKLLSEQLLSRSPSSMSILDYVSSFRERLHKACEIANAHLVACQTKMKAQYDRKVWYVISRLVILSSSCFLYLALPCRLGSLVLTPLRGNSVIPIT